MLRWFGRKRAEQEPPAREARLFVTPGAHERLLEVLGRQPGAMLRVLDKEPGSGQPRYDMQIETEAARPDDTVIDVDGVQRVVYAQSLPSVIGVTIDFVADPLRPGFRIDPPVPGADPSDPLAAQVRHVLDTHINPGVASHGGYVELVGVKD